MSTKGIGDIGQNIHSQKDSGASSMIFQSFRFLIHSSLNWEYSVSCGHASAVSSDTSIASDGRYPGGLFHREEQNRF